MNVGGDWEPTAQDFQNEAVNVCPLKLLFYSLCVMHAYHSYKSKPKRFGLDENRTGLFDGRALPGLAVQTLRST